eukprot:tig00000900_g5364.t1
MRLSMTFLRPAHALTRLPSRSQIDLCKGVRGARARGRRLSRRARRTERARLDGELFARRRALLCAEQNRLCAEVPSIAEQNRLKTGPAGVRGRGGGAGGGGRSPGRLAALRAALAAAREARRGYFDNAAFARGVEAALELLAEARAAEWPGARGRPLHHVAPAASRAASGPPPPPPSRPPPPPAGLPERGKHPAARAAPPTYRHSGLLSPLIEVY